MKKTRLKKLAVMVLAVVMLLSVSMPFASATEKPIKEQQKVSGTLSYNNSSAEYVLSGMKTSSYWGIRLTVTVKNTKSYEIWLTEWMPDSRFDDLWDPNYSVEFYPSSTAEYETKTANGFVYESPVVKYVIDEYKYTISIPEYMWEDMSESATFDYTLELYYKSTMPSSGFYDVPDGQWYTDSVKYVVNNGLFSGTGLGYFEPDAVMTRGMLVTVLGRRAGIDKSDYPGSSFSDVKSTEYYAPFVNWASEIGVVGGIGKGKFNPEGVVTRQDLATILYRYVKYCGGDTSIDGTSAYNKFTDRGSITDYAVTPLKWAVSKGIINGVSPTSISPKGYATRAQVAKIFMVAESYLDYPA